MFESIKFGDIFKYREKEYVFLAKTEEIFYTSQILAEKETKQINDLFEKRCRGQNRERLKRHPLYCYVILKTEEFKNRMAHFKNTGQDELGLIDKTGNTLNEEDLREIKKEIINPNSPLPRELKQLVATLDF